MISQIPLTSDSIADLTYSKMGTREIAPDLAYQRIAMVNVVFYGKLGCGDRRWVLIDAGVNGFSARIERAAYERFGEGARPAAIILTHGHFDHTGCVGKLARKWDAPIYAHQHELPYLNGSAAYPRPDPMVGGGGMPWIALFFPRGPIDIGPWLHPLPANHGVPNMPGWRWLHTPGHTAGHVSLWREDDSTVIAGDAFTTTGTESIYSMALQEEEMHGPPTYSTPDWHSAGRSVRNLAALKPELAITGHGRAMRGVDMRAALYKLGQEFYQVAVPKNGSHSACAKNQTDNQL